MEKERKRQRKLDPCYHTGIIPNVINKNRKDILIYYPFAVEYQDPSSFLAPLEPSYYLIRDGLLNPLNSFSEKTISQEEQKHNHKKFCKKCQNDNPAEYDRCSDRPYVSRQYSVPLDISEKHSNEKQLRCEICGYSFFLTPSCIESSTLDLQDVRLLGLPAALKITRHRLRCTSCNRLQGEEELLGIQASCKSSITSRLASEILFEQLSNIKRVHIAEAYGISVNQIDRIKERMIEKSSAHRLQSAYSEITSGRSHRVEDLEIDLKGEKYIAYFVTEDPLSVKLIDILPMSVRLALQQKPDLSNTALKGMSKEAYLLACYCCLAAERTMDGKDLMDALSDCEELFLSTRNEIQQLQSPTLSFLSGQPQNTEFLKSYFRREPQDFVERDDGQMMLREMQASPSEGEQDQRASAAILDEFVFALSTAKRGRLSPKKLIDILLDFNPAAVSHLEIKLFTGDSTSEYPADLLRSEGSCMYKKAWGVPVPCLTYLVRNGILRNQQRGHITCYLRSDPAEVSKNSKEGLPLPCGMTNIACPHCQRV